MAGYAKQRSNWQDFPTTTTPLLAANLNALETAIYNLKHDAAADLAADYGADNTGAVDCASAVNSALADVAAGTAGSGIFFGPGTYKITSAISVPVASYLKQIGIFGAGIGLTKINYSGTGYCFTFGDASTSRAFGQGVRDLTIDCSASSIPSGCVRFNGSHFGFVDHCELIAPSGGSKICLYFDPGTGISHNYFQRIVGCRIAGTTAASDVGIKLYSTTGTGANSNYIVNNWLAGFVQSILIDGGDSNLIEGNEFNGSTTTGIKLQSANTVNNLLMSNQFDGPTTAIDIGVSVDQTMLLMNRPSTMSVSDAGTNTIRFDPGAFTYGVAANLNLAAGLVFTGNGPSVNLGAFSAGNIGNVAFRSAVSGDANNRFIIRGTGLHEWGAGGATAVDTNLKRNAANQLQTDDQFIAIDGVQTKYLSGAGKTTVVDADFTATPPNGTLAVHFDSTATRTYLSVRSNGTWHVMAGPIV